MKQLKSLNATALLWLIPSFFIWDALQSKILSPLLIMPANIAVTVMYPNEGFNLAYQDSGTRVLHSRILAKAPLKDSSQISLVSQPLQSNRNILLGLPLYWALLLSLSTSWRQKFSQLFIGSGALLVGITLMFCFDTILDASYMLEETKGRQYYSLTGELLYITEVNTSLLTFADTVRKLLFYIVVLLFPILLICFHCFGNPILSSD